MTQADETGAADIHVETALEVLRDEDAAVESAVGGATEIPSSVNHGAELQPLAADAILDDTIDRAIAERLRDAIERTRGNRSEAAKMLGLNRTKFYRLLRQLENQPALKR